MKKNSSGFGYTLFRSLCRIAFLVYMLAVIYITIIVREPEERRFSFELFNSYRLLFEDKNYFYFDMIILNIAMLVPFGILVPLNFKKADKAFKVILLGFSFSLCIEIVQFITGRGLFELDDLFNNTIGAALGYVMLAVLKKIFIKNLSDRKKIHDMKKV